MSLSSAVKRCGGGGDGHADRRGAGIFAALRAASRRSRDDRCQRAHAPARAGADHRRRNAPRGRRPRRARARRHRRHADGGFADRDRPPGAHGDRAWRRTLGAGPASARASRKVRSSKYEVRG